MAIEHKITISEALQYFGSGYSLENDDYTTLIWLDTKNPKPTLEQLNDKVAELQADYDSKQYQRDRAEQYPSIADVIVALAEKEEGNDAMWQEITAKRTKVKADNPKP